MDLNHYKYCIALLNLTVLIMVTLIIFTIINLQPIPESLDNVLASSAHVQILDRYGTPLNSTYQNEWNVHDSVALHEVPEFLKQALIISEDKRFYEHSGPDWLARGAALISNLKAMRSVRGASTITEQVVRMLHPRPRTVWSRWLEGFEATKLEQRFSKAEILEFYLNQVPYGAKRRGIVQAANYYFARDLSTLSKKEMLALIVLVRAPSRLDLWHDSSQIESGIKRLSTELLARGLLSATEQESLLVQKFNLQTPQLSINAPEFVQYVKQQPLAHYAGWPQVKTTLDGGLQQRVQTLLDQRLEQLPSQKVENGAVLAVDHHSGEVLVWAVAGKADANTPGRFIDAVLTPRQPGSALKPMLYALALTQGWSAATVIDDTPLTETVGSGLHAYQNYSRTFYGPVTLRQALGNSLNIPALKTLQYVGAENYLNYLNTLGFAGLDQHPDFYGDGIALGNGEVTLYELVQAYASIANQGMFQPLTPFVDGLRDGTAYPVLSPAIASLIANILSDPMARQMEFGKHSVLNFPVETAVKTGTSNDYHDSWAVGFNYRYTVGVWLGNLDRQPTDGLTGSLGPALLLRAVFAELNQHQATKALSIHKSLVQHDVCIESKQLQLPEQSCETYSEWFVPGTEPVVSGQTTAAALALRLRSPSDGLHLAYDPRLPAAAQAFEFYIQGVAADATVNWNINGESVITQGGRYVWPLERGQHELQASVWENNQHIATLAPVHFIVK